MQIRYPAVKKKKIDTVVLHTPTLSGFQALSLPDKVLRMICRLEKLYALRIGISLKYGLWRWNGNDCGIKITIVKCDINVNACVL